MKIRHLSRFTGLWALALVYLCLSFWAAKTFSFEEFLQGIDFEQLTKDIEKAVEEAEQKGQLPQPPAMFQPGMPTSPIQPLDLTLTTPTPQKTGDQTQDLETLFLEPIKVIEEKGKKEPIKVSDQKQKAYEHYMGQMVELMATLEQAIETNPEFSDTFRSFFTQFQDAIDEIIVQKDIIGSKKLYLALLFTDNEATNELRKKIVTTVKELTKLCNQVKLSETEELTTTEREEKRLRKLAEQQFTEPKPRRDIERKKRGRRGAPEKRMPMKKNNTQREDS